MSTIPVPSILFELRQLAVGAVIRGVAHEFGLKEKLAIEQIMGACEVSAPEIQRWAEGDGIPEAYVQRVLRLLNTNNPRKWAPWQVRPRMAEAHLWQKIENERRVSRAMSCGRRLEVGCES